MSEPVFTVPFSALVDVSEFGPGLHWWSCRVQSERIADCERVHRVPDESAARAAAIAHLESVHGIRAAGGDELGPVSGETEWQVRYTSRLLGEPFEFVSYVGVVEAQARAAFTHESADPDSSDVRLMRHTGYWTDWEQVDDE